MTWFKIDDDFCSHPKVIEAGNSAVGLFARGGSWSSRHLTEGHIPSSIALSLGSAREIAQLVKVGLWVEKDDGYQVPNFLEFNPTRAKVQAARHAAADRQRNARLRAASRRD